MWKPPASLNTLHQASESAQKPTTPASFVEKQVALHDAALKQDKKITSLENTAELHPNPIYGDQALFHKGIESIIDIAIYMIDTQGVVRTWSPSAARIKGYAKEEILGQHYSKFYLKDQIESGFLEFEMCEAREKGHYEDKGWRIRRDGTRFWADEIITPIYGDNHEHLGYCKTTRDLSSLRLVEEKLTAENQDLTVHLQKQVLELETANQQLAQEAQERQRIQTNLHNSEERYRKLIEVTQHIVWTVEPTGCFTTPQPSWERFTGQTWEQYHDFGWTNAIHPEDRAALLQAWHHAVETSRPYHSTPRLWYKEGYYRHVIANAAPLYNQAGHVYDMISSERLLLKEASLHRKNVLIVEDNAVNQRILKRILDKIGHNSYSVNNGKEAVTIIEEGKHHFDMILMDIEMPILNGLEATELIRQHERVNHSLNPIPIIGLSAHANVEDKSNALAKGMNDYFCKPIKAEEVAVKIAYWTSASVQSNACLYSSGGSSSIPLMLSVREKPPSSPLLSTLFSPIKAKNTEETPETALLLKKQKADSSNNETTKEEDIRKGFMPS